ncbi:MAG TPA: hypothetical protein VM165_18745, partial [Planctomycetaceae bacterium]|nr:hypothetical protein [Planctomycetaceae bacterium]
SQSQRSVTGTISLGSLTGTFKGTVSGNALTATAVMQDVPTDTNVMINVTLDNWNTTLTGSTQTGGFKIVFRVPSVTGSATVTATIDQLTR